MGHIVSDRRFGANQGGRHAASFKDGTFVRVVDVRQENVLVVCAVEGSALYFEYACPRDFSIQSVSCETSSFTGTLVLILGGFTPETDDSRTVVISTDYQIQPPVWYGQGG